MRILIAADGSEFSDRAIEEACTIAENMKNTEIAVISAYELPAPLATEPFVPVPMYTQEVADAAKDTAVNVVRRAKRTISRRCPDARIRGRVCLGWPPAVVLEEAKTWNADLLVVGSHGYGFWQRAVLGSVSTAIVNQAPCSVLVVKKSAA